MDDRARQALPQPHEQRLGQQRVADPVGRNDQNLGHEQLRKVLPPGGQ
jgi:hypothetical protein